MSVFLTLVICAASFAAQDVEKRIPDISGTWVDGDITLKIKIVGPKITISSTHRTGLVPTLGRLDTFSLTSERVYYSDGRGETQKELKAKSVTRWEGNKLVIRTSSIQTSDGKTTSVDQTQVWEMSEDGTELMRTRVYRVAGEEKKTRELFSRKNRR